MRAPTARGGEAPGRYLPKVPLPTRPSDTSHRRLNRDPRFLTARLCSLRLTLLPPTHVNALASTESRCLPSWETCTGALSDLGLALSPGWPARRGAARVHRGLLTSTRPLFVRSSRAPSRPRALSRLLQTMLPRARPRTTSNIPNDRKPSLGRLPFLSRVASRWDNRQSCSRSGAEEHRTSALSIEIALSGDFAPTSIASGTSCREDRSSPCPERRGRTAEPPAQRTLARSAQRQGRAAPHLREEARRSPTRGAFHHQALRIADGPRGDRLASQTAPHHSAFFTVDRPG